MTFINRIKYLPKSSAPISPNQVLNHAIDQIVADIKSRLSKIDTGSHDVTFYIDGEVSQLSSGKAAAITFVRTGDAQTDQSIENAIAAIYGPGTDV